MPNRRDFLKRTALFGMGTAAALTARQDAFAQQESAAPPAGGADGNTYTVDMDFIRAKPLPPRVITIPDVDGFKVLKGDFHIHTLFSDGTVMPKERVEEAVGNGLDVIAITDHIEYPKWISGDKHKGNYNLSYNAAKPEADKRNLILVRGAEITKLTMPPGHFNTLFASDNNPIAAAVDDWRKMLQTASDLGAFLLWNHPGWQVPKAGGIKPGAPLRFHKEHEEIYKKGLMHGIEIFNYVSYYPVVSDWCNERDLAIIANSDIHSSEQNLYGLRNTLRPITLVLAKERTYDSIKEAFFAKRTIGWAAGMILGRPQWVERLFESCVEIKRNGETLQLTNKSDIPCQIQVGKVIQELKKQGELTLTADSSVKKLTVANWLVGTAKPLEVLLG